MSFLAGDARYLFKAIYLINENPQTVTVYLAPFARCCVSLLLIQLLSCPINCRTVNYGGVGHPPINPGGVAAKPTQIDETTKLNACIDHPMPTSKHHTSCNFVQGHRKKTTIREWSISFYTKIVTAAGACCDCPSANVHSTLVRGGGQLGHTHRATNTCISSDKPFLLQELLKTYLQSSTATTPECLGQKQDKTKTKQYKKYQTKGQNKTMWHALHLPEASTPHTPHSKSKILP